MRGKSKSQNGQNGGVSTVEVGIVAVARGTRRNAEGTAVLPGLRWQGVVETRVKRNTLVNLEERKKILKYSSKYSKQSTIYSMTNKISGAKQKDQKGGPKQHMIF